MEKILCTATWFKKGTCPEKGPKNIYVGYVICGYDRESIDNLHVHLTNDYPRNIEDVELGFLTTENRFVDRVEAMSIACKSDQVINKNSLELISSNLVY